MAHRNAIDVSPIRTVDHPADNVLSYASVTIGQGTDRVIAVTSQLYHQRQTAEAWRIGAFDARNGAEPDRRWTARGDAQGVAYVDGHRSVRNALIEWKAGR